VVEGFFNAAFRPTSGLRHVPVSRVDFSGYGASAFSKWINENASAVDVTKVEFDLLTGRTSYGVVEVQSILWPCMARVVRRITLRREGNGAAVREGKLLRLLQAWDAPGRPISVVYPSNRYLSARVRVFAEFVR
jgi:hypothetical protein